MKCIGLLIAPLALLCLPALGQQYAVPSDLVPEVRRSESLGAALFKAFGELHNSESKIPSGLVTLAESAVRDRCDGPYRTLLVRVSDAGSESLFAYVIGVPDTSTGVMVGRHFRVELDAVGGTVRSVFASTKSCLFIPAKLVPPGGSPVGAFMSHILSATPSEFHVFLSLLHSRPMFVGTDRAIWNVENGIIAVIKPK